MSFHPTTFIRPSSCDLFSTTLTSASWCRTSQHSTSKTRIRLGASSLSLRRHSINYKISSVNWIANPSTLTSTWKIYERMQFKSTMSSCKMNWRHSSSTKRRYLKSAKRTGKENRRTCKKRLPNSKIIFTSWTLTTLLSLLIARDKAIKDQQLRSLSHRSAKKDGRDQEPHLSLSRRRL
jgi:hypothetical protein